MMIADTKKTFALVGTPANKKLVSQLESGGAKVISLPAARVEKNDLDEESQALLGRAHTFDWLIFFDVIAVDYFLAALEETGIDYFELDRALVCALGEAVADRLRFVQIHSDVIPNRLEDDRVFTSLAGYIGDEEIEGKTFLSIKRLGVSSDLEKLLSAKGATVAELEIYRAEIDQQNENARLNALLKGGAVDEFVFTSPEDLTALKIFARRESAAELLSGTKISAIGEVTFQFLRENNLKPVYFNILI